MIYQLTVSSVLEFVACISRHEHYSMDIKDIIPGPRGHVGDTRNLFPRSPFANLLHELCPTIRCIFILPRGYKLWSALLLLASFTLKTFYLSCLKSIDVISPSYLLMLRICYRPFVFNSDSFYKLVFLKKSRPH